MKNSNVLLGIDKLLSLGMWIVACRRGVECLRLIPTINAHLVTDALTFQTHWVTPRLASLRFVHIIHRTTSNAKKCYGSKRAWRESLTTLSNEIRRNTDLFEYGEEVPILDVSVNDSLVTSF